MTSNQDIAYWQTNSDWYYFDETDWAFYMRESAPEKAKRSFEMMHDYPAVKGAKDFTPGRVKYQPFKDFSLEP